MAEEIRELGIDLQGLATHDPRLPGTLPGDVARFLDLPDRVTNPTTLAALDTTTFLAGKTRIAEVVSLAAFFYFSSTSTATPDGTTVIAPGAGSGRWLIWPGSSSSSIPRVADIAALVALATGGYPTTMAHLAEVLTTRTFWKFVPVTTTGPFSNVTAYTVGQRVIYLGSIYTALNSTTGNLPTDPTHWVLYFGGVTGQTAVSTDNLGMWCRFGIADVPNLATLALLPGLGIPTSESHRCFVQTVGDWFRYVPGGTATADGITVIASLDGLGQWQRMGIENQQWLQATCWSVSPATGSDENLGCGTSTAASDAVPLKTLGELNRLLIGWNQDNTVAGLGGGLFAMDIHLMDDCVTPAAFQVLSNMNTPNGTNKYARFIGGLHAVDGGASNRTITGYTAAVPSTNTERTIVISGLGTVPQYIGKMVQTTDGLRTAFVTSQPSADHLTISQVNSGGSLIDASSNGVSDFAINDHVNFLDAVKLADWPFSPSVRYPVLAQVRLDCGTGGVFPTGNMGKSNVIVSQCFLGSGALTGQNEFYLIGGTGSASVFCSCAMFGTHANGFEAGSAQWDGVAMFSGQDGPFVTDYNLLIGTELTVVPYGGTFGVGLRSGGTAPCRIVVADVGSIASWRMHNSIVDLVSTHFGKPGDFQGSDSVGSASKWYGSGNTSYLLVLGQGTRSKFPKSGLFATTSAAHPINLAGTGFTDTFNCFDWADIPIMDLNTMSSIGDSNPGTSGGRF